MDPCGPLPEQNGISRVYNMLEIYHSCPEPSNHVLQLSSETPELPFEQATKKSNRALRQTHQA